MGIKMRIKALVDEDFVNYKKPSMFISTCFCNWKCCTELGKDVCMCQNCKAYENEIKFIDDDAIINRYMKNIITSAIVFGGFEVFYQFDEVYNFIEKFRNYSNDDVVIYTGYYENEVTDKISKLKKFKNIIVKFGRFIPDDDGRFDEVLGVHLASKNQYATSI